MQFLSSKNITTKFLDLAKISVTATIVINMPTREPLAAEKNSSFVKLFEHLNNKNNVYKQMSSLYFICAT